MEPGIEIKARGDAITIRQNRPAVAGLLHGLTPTEALSRIPILLPICGNAQEIAGERALAAARGIAAADEDQRGSGSSRRLEREQAFAAAWRLAVDWPAVFGGEKQMAELKSVRDASDPETRNAALLAFLPGLNGVEDAPDLHSWIEQSPAPPARALCRVLEQEKRLPEPEHLQPSTGEELVDRARTAFAAEAFDPLNPAGGGIEVGPLALNRHPLLAELSSGGDYGRLSLRLVAQLLDTLVIAEAQLHDAQEREPNGWNEADGRGLGRAMTARGPVFHRVELEGEDRVADWRVLAPTDWHFARGGPFERAAAALAAAQSEDCDLVKVLILGFDPCAPWTLSVEETADA